MDGHVVHALFRLGQDGIDDHVAVEIIRAVFGNDFIDRHRADRDGACVDDRAADQVDVSAGAEVHHGIGTVPDSLIQFPFFRLRTA